jgi:ATP-dependent Lon protease
VVSELPLFPLRLVLFPGVHLPLHIFEPRYRRMLADCLAGDRHFGIIYRPDGVAEREIPSGQIGCIARVERAEMLPDGRSNVLVVGTGRFALDRFEETAMPYCVGRVTEVGDAPESAASLALLATAVRALFVRVGTAARRLNDDGDALPDLPGDAALLAFAIAAVIDMEPGARQRLLASLSASARLREVEMLMAPAVESLEARAVVHTRAKSNGHGPQPQSPG